MELSPALAQIDQLKKEADALRPFKPEWEKVFWEKFRLEFNYNSNHMEGNTMTYGHTQLLLIFDKVGGDYTGREVEEMKNHDVAMKLVKEAASGPEHILTEKFIKEINQTILVRPYYNEAITPEGQPTRRLIEPGQYKKYPNSVLLANGEMFNYASPEETPALMGDLMEWYRKESGSKELHSVQLAALFHYRFVRIHPFDDSNGRTTRLLMNYILMKNGYVPVVIESADKRNYLNALNRADTGDIEAFVEYIISKSIRWEGLYLKAVKGEQIEEAGDFEKEVEVLKKSFTKNRKITAVFSKDEVINLFESSIFSLLNQLINKISTLDHFYHSAEMRFGINGPNFSIKKIEQIKQVFEEQKEKISQNCSIDFTYLHKGLYSKKNGVVDYYHYLSFKFFEYTYQITLSPASKPYIEKKYSENLSEIEINELILKISKDGLEYIKENP